MHAPSQRSRTLGWIRLQGRVLAALALLALVGVVALGGASPADSTTEPVTAETSQQDAGARQGAADRSAPGARADQRADGTADADAGGVEEEAASELTIPKALLLGVVEGITEYLPVSSTGHLLVVQPLIGVGVTEETADAAASYAISIQAGAILAVAFLYHRKLLDMAAGVVGRSQSGRRLAIGLGLAFIPAVIVGLAFEAVIKEHLLGPWPVVVAWAAWGLVLILTAPRMHSIAGTAALEAITTRQALLIGAAQCLAMWPGTSRSLVTILAAVLVGLSMRAAVEFSFLLGFLTLGAATAYESMSSGTEVFDTFGVVSPLVGLLAAFVSAALSIRWLLSYLQRHSLAIFGWYRLVIAAITVILLVNGTI